jgi:cell wall-associated NlpC family hydrolase
MASYSWDFINGTTAFMKGISPSTGPYAMGIGAGVNGITQAALQRKMAQQEAAASASFMSGPSSATPPDSELANYGWTPRDPDMVHRDKAIERWRQANPQSAGLNAGALPSGISQYLPLIQEASSKFGVPANNIAAIMTMESNGNANARSVQGAMGLMQVMPFNAHGANLMDPAQNIMTGTKILADNYAKYGDWGKSAAAYLGAVDANGNPTYNTDALGTSGVAYAQKFKNLAQRYAGLVSGATDLLREGNKYIGTPYVWGGGRGGTLANGTDCSAFTSQVYKQFTGGKVNLTPYTDAQFNETYAVDQPRIGDLVFYEGGDQPGTRFGHVAIYAGAGQVLDASTRSAGGVEYRPLYINGMTPIFRRPYGV